MSPAHLITTEAAYRLAQARLEAAQGAFRAYERVSADWEARERPEPGTPAYGAYLAQVAKIAARRTEAALEAEAASVERRRLYEQLVEAQLVEARASLSGD